MFPILLGLTIGFILPIQTSINSRLRIALGSPFSSSLASFLLGSVFLTGVCIVSAPTLLPSAAFIASHPWWLYLGGLCGVIFLTSNILLFPRIGAVQTAIFPVVGQITMGLLIDNFGWFRAPVTSLGATRAAGAVLVVIGVVVAVAVPEFLRCRSGTFASKPASAWLWRMFGLCGGALSAEQTAINGQLGIALKSPHRAALVSFLVGSVALIIIVAILRPENTYVRTKSMHRWWMWIGGFIGASFVLGNAYLSPMLGTGLTVVLTLIGMMCGGIAIDVFGWLGAQRKGTSLVQIAGILMMICGVAIIRLLG